MKNEEKLNVIIKIVCDWHEIPFDFVQRKTREMTYTLPRQKVHFLARKNTKMSNTMIGQYVGLRDNATVINSCKRIQERIDSYSSFAVHMSELQDKIDEIIITPITIHELKKKVKGIIYDVYLEDCRIFANVRDQQLKLIAKTYPKNDFDIHIFNDGILIEGTTIKTIYDYGIS